MEIGREQSVSDSPLFKCLEKACENFGQQSGQTRKILLFAWAGLACLHERIESCIATKLHVADFGYLAIIRLAQGIRTDLSEVIMKAEFGYYSSCGPILRSAFENATILTAVSQDKVKLSELVQGKLKSTRCIAAAQKVFEGTGEHYGHLTEMGVHHSLETYGQNLDPNDGEKHSIPMSPRHSLYTETQCPLITEALIRNCKMTVFVLELVFHSSLTELRETKSENGITTFLSSGYIKNLEEEHLEVVAQLKKDMAEFTKKLVDRNL